MLGMEGLWVATSQLELLGLKVRVWVCEGAYANRKFFKVHPSDISCEYEGIQYASWNHYSPFDPNSQREIFYICDVPPFLKTMHDNLKNSHSNSIFLNDKKC